MPSPGPPPPPPPPCPTAPPPPISSPPPLSSPSPSSSSCSSSSMKGDTRGDLLKAIQAGKTLKKTVTKERGGLNSAAGGGGGGREGGGGGAGVGRKGEGYGGKGKGPGKDLLCEILQGKTLRKTSNSGRLAGAGAGAGGGADCLKESGTELRGRCASSGGTSSPLVKSIQEGKALRKTSPRSSSPKGGEGSGESKSSLLKAIQDEKVERKPINSFAKKLVEKSTDKKVINAKSEMSKSKTKGQEVGGMEDQKTGGPASATQVSQKL